MFTLKVGANLTEEEIIIAVFIYRNVIHIKNGAEYENTKNHNHV